MLPAPVLLEAWASTASAIVQRCQDALSHPIVTALQFHGIYLACLLATLWVMAGRARLRELERQRRRSLGRPPDSRGSLAALAAAEQEVRGLGVGRACA